LLFLYIYVIIPNVNTFNLVLGKYSTITKFKANKILGGKIMTKERKQEIIEEMKKTLVLQKFKLLF